MQVNVVSFGNNPLLVEREAYVCHHLQSTLDNGFGEFRTLLDSFVDDSIVILVDSERVTAPPGLEKTIRQFEDSSHEVLFSASTSYHYDDEGLRYYFWKYYPRGASDYHYLDTAISIARAKDFARLLKQLVLEYPTQNTWSDLVNRYYVDQCLGAIDAEVQVAIDHASMWFTNLSGQVSAVRWPMLSWVQKELFNRFEKRRLALRGLDGFRDTPWSKVDDKSIVVLPRTGTERIKTRLAGEQVSAKPFMVFAISLLAYFQSLYSAFIARIINRGTIKPYRIFRYSANKSPEWKETMSKFLGHLERGEGFTFAHFNDGEMTFIKKYLDENHTETWFGRRQQKYNKQLGERLTGALKLERRNYYVGVPCSTHHPKLRNLADALTQNHSGVVPAMSLHHNPRYFPNIINHMKDRECFFIKNEYQKLEVFERLGVTIKDDNQVIVPFKNSYLLYDELKDKKFPEGSMVILICGMLAKIIIPVWFENNPHTTFIALGSSMDDFIQRTNTKFRLYPKEGLPLTCNIQPTKFFAFGWKKECSECWSMEEHVDVH